MRSAAFAACVRAISETAGMLPLAFRERVGQGWRKIDDAPIAYLLNGFANPWSSAAELRTQLVVDAFLHRNGGLAVVARIRGEPRELHRVRPGTWALEFDENTLEPAYRISTGNDGSRLLPFGDVIHVVPPGWAVERPRSVLDYCRDAVAIDIALAQHEGDVFRHGGLPRIVLSPEGQITPDATKKAIEFLTRQASNVGKPIVLPASMKEAFRSFGLGDMQFVELRRLAIEEVARAARVPATVIGDLSKGTYANTEQQNRQFLTLSLLPWLEQLEAAFTRALIPAERRVDREIEFITEDLLRGDIAARSAAYRQAAGGSWLTRNEVRELEGRPPIAGADELLNQAGQTNASGNEPAGDITKGPTDA